ncbi:MAG: tRNA pseudouridine(38-40) synthase TruA [Polyangiaceae bacterium]
MTDEAKIGVLVTVAYDGTNFHGWARQEAVRTVEATLTGAVRSIDGTVDEVRGSSRTDSGVHALGQLVAFDTSKTAIPLKGWVLGLNQTLPDDVAVRSARHVPVGFVPRFAAKGKRYRYRLHTEPVRSPLVRDRAWHVPRSLDRQRMEREAAAVVGTHDFAAFRSASDERTMTVRTITRVVVETDPETGGLAVVVEGTGFMHNMVRILVGTLVDVGTGRKSEGTIAKALASKERGDAGITAPAHGLVLDEVHVELPPGTDDRWPP